MPLEYLRSSLTQFFVAAGTLETEISQSTTMENLPIYRYWKPHSVNHHAVGANDRIRAGIIGSGGRGRYLPGEFKEIGAEMAAVCDIYEPNLQHGLNFASTGAKSYRNYRHMLKDKSLDIVIVATPDHWHAHMVIDAVTAGKDVYVEKPMAHKIDEGFDVVAAVRHTGRIVQVGTERRSAEMFLEAKRIMDSGKLGEIRLVTSSW